MIARGDALPLVAQAQQSDAARPASAGARAGKPATCRDADEAGADRGALPPTEHVEAAPAHKNYPYLLRKLAVTRSNQVWAADITYAPMARGFVYLVALSTGSGQALSTGSPGGYWRGGCRSSSTPSSGSRPEEALARYGKPTIFNSDHASQFTSTAFTAVLLREKIAISMDGKGCWRDDVFVERLWRSVK